MKIKVQSMKESRINSYRESDNEEVLMFKLGELQKNGKLDGFSIVPDEDELKDNEVYLNIDNSSQCDDVFEVLRLCKSSGVIADFHKNADSSFIVTNFKESKKRSKKEGVTKGEDGSYLVTLDNGKQFTVVYYPNDLGDYHVDVMDSKTRMSWHNDFDNPEDAIKWGKKQIAEMELEESKSSKRENYEGTYYYTDEQPYALIDGNNKLEAMAYSKDEVDQMKRTGKDVFGYPIDGCKFIYVGEGEFTESEIRAKLRESKKHSKKESDEPEFDDTYEDGYQAGKDDYESGHPMDPDDISRFSKEFRDGYWKGFYDAQEEDNEEFDESKSLKKESIDNNSAVKLVKDRVKKEFPEFKVVGPTSDMYDGPRSGKIQFYIPVPEDSTEGYEVEKMLQEVESEYPDFEYEGYDWNNKYWFNISE